MQIFPRWLDVLPVGCLIQVQSRINEDFLINQQVPLGFIAMFAYCQICISNQWTSLSPLSHAGSCDQEWLKHKNESPMCNSMVWQSIEKIMKFAVTHTGFKSQLFYLLGVERESSYPTGLSLMFFLVQITQNTTQFRTVKINWVEGFSTCWCSFLSPLYSLSSLFHLVIV